MKVLTLNLILLSIICFTKCSTQHKSDVIEKISVKSDDGLELSFFYQKDFVELGFDCEFFDNLSFYKKVYINLIDDLSKKKEWRFKSIYIEKLDCMDRRKIEMIKQLHVNFYGKDKVNVVEEEHVIVVKFLERRKEMPYPSTHEDAH